MRDKIIHLVIAFLTYTVTLAPIITKHIYADRIYSDEHLDPGTSPNLRSITLLRRCSRVFLFFKQSTSNGRFFFKGAPSKKLHEISL